MWIPMWRPDPTRTRDTLVDLIVSKAGGATAKATSTAALESVAGLLSRAFALAEVHGPAPIVAAFTPAIRSMLGRALIRRGELVAGVDVLGTSMVMLPASSHDITGGYDPRSWTYRLQLAGPSSSSTRTARGDDVFHFRGEVDPSQPWRGIAPLESAALAGRLSAELVNALGDEVSGARGYLLPIPVDGLDKTVELLKSDIKKLAGQTAVVESQVTGQFRPTDGSGASSRSEWMPRRLGAHPPEALVKLQDCVTKEVWAALGVSESLFMPRDATSAREAMRSFLTTVVLPLGELVAIELSAKTGEAITMTFDRLRASDIQGRARAFASMTGGGMDVSTASRLSGFTE